MVGNPQRTFGRLPSAVALLVVTLLGMGLLLAGCARAVDPGAAAVPAPTGPAPSPTTAGAGVIAPTGQIAVRDFLEALEGGDPELATSLVPETQLALLVGVEEPTGALMADLLSSGVSARVADNFWKAFSDSFEPFAGSGLSGWELASDRAVIVDGVTYVFVEVEHDVGASELVATETPAGWVVDLVASFGHAFAPVFNHWLDNGPGHETVWGPVMADQIASVEMSIERTNPASVYQQDLAAWVERISRLQP